MSNQVQVPMNTLSNQLKQLIEKAIQIRSAEFTEIVKLYKDVFKRYSLRLRPSVNSISLVSCANWTPQIGFSKMTSGSTLEKTLEGLKSGDDKLELPDRPTPEKALQSWLISQAMGSEGRMSAIDSALDDDHSYWFVSDEIALTAPDKDGASGNRVVADLLVVREDKKNGECEIVNVELKSQRTTETHEQIQTFWDFMGPSEIQLWRKFAETMLEGKQLRWKQNNGRKGIVIWPGPLSESRPNPRTVEMITKLRAEGVDTICYSGPIYNFRPERI